MPSPRKPPKSPHQARELLFSELSADSAFYQIFNHLPDVAFFAKDAQCRIIGASRLFFERFGFHTEAEILGKDDFELFPRTLAETFRKDDEAVLSSGQPAKPKQKMEIYQLLIEENRKYMAYCFVLK
jgi:hypothetical protein